MAAMQHVNARPRIHGLPDSLELGAHAAHGKAPPVLFRERQHGIHVLHPGNDGLPLSSGGIQAVHARQNEQRVSLHQTRDVHGKNIVIPKFQLFHGYGVVLIHNRDDAAVLKQAQHRSLHIATAAFQILRRQQKLGHIYVKVVEKILICLHQPRLPYGGARLFQGQLLRIGRKTQDGHAGPYSAGADQNHLMALLHQPRQGAHQMHDGRTVQRPILSGQHARTYFNYDFHVFPPLMIQQSLFPQKAENASFPR